MRHEAHTHKCIHMYVCVYTAKRALISVLFAVADVIVVIPQPQQPEQRGPASCVLCYVHTCQGYTCVWGRKKERLRRSKRVSWLARGSEGSNAVCCTLERVGDRDGKHQQSSPFAAHSNTSIIAEGGGVKTHKNTRTPAKCARGIQTINRKKPFITAIICWTVLKRNRTKEEKWIYRGFNFGKNVFSYDLREERLWKNVLDSLHPSALKNRQKRVYFMHVWVSGTSRWVCVDIHTYTYIICM